MYSPIIKCISLKWGTWNAVFFLLCYRYRIKKTIMIYPIPNPKLHELFCFFFFIWHWSVTLENWGLILYFQGILSGNYLVINRNIKCHAIIFHRLADFGSHINRRGKNCPRCDVQKSTFHLWNYWSFLQCNILTK